MEQREKPPIELKPQFAKLIQQQNEIKETLVRFMDEDYPIPVNWIKLYNQNCKEIKGR